MASKVRLDELLVERGFFADANAALRAVIAREVRVDDVYVTSAAIKVSPDADIFVKGGKPYVSRGGFKLAGALDAFGLDVSGKRCIDVGASTGGFTDCLLQRGAAHVACVDVGYGQLAWKLQEDERVTVFDRTNIRLADPAELGAPFDVIVCDVSFIGLSQIAPALATLGQQGSMLVALIKPQFESQQGETQGGIVTDSAVHERVIDEVRQALQQVGFVVHGVVESSITGTHGNIEFLCHASLQ